MGRRRKARRKRTLKGLYANINARRKAGKSRSKKKSTISPSAYAFMKAGFKKRKKTWQEKEQNEGLKEKRILD